MDEMPGNKIEDGGEARERMQRERFIQEHLLGGELAPEQQTAARHYVETHTGPWNYYGDDHAVERTTVAGDVLEVLFVVSCDGYPVSEMIKEIPLSE